MVLNLIKKILPRPLINYLNKIFKRNEFEGYLKEIKRIRLSHNKKVNLVKRQGIIKIVFLVIHDAVWKYEEIYRLLERDPNFEVQIAVIPMVQNGTVNFDVYNKTLDHFETHDYNVLSSFDEANNIWIEIKEISNPDIVFFTNPHKITFEKYYINNFLEKLNCYVPYAFVVIGTIDIHYDQKFHHVLWKYFIETKEHEKFADKYNKHIDRNTVVSGFPGLDKKFSINYIPKNVWKKTKTNRKKIIWAPHHTISSQGGDLDYSSFLEYYENIFELLKERKDIQIAFKPHPLLKQKLYLDSNWGIEKTNKYYDLWNTIPNGQLEEGEYLDLFSTSDAMIMDSASFIVEYLYFNKPIQFTMRENVLERFNSFGQLVFNYLYKATNWNEMIKFINEIVIEENDPMLIERNSFFENQILPENGLTASENIYNELKRELC